MARNHPARIGSRTAKSFTQLKKLYIVIVLSILLFLCVQQILIHVSVNKSKAYARHINLVGRQRMLSQKIAKLSLQYQMGMDCRNELLSDLKTWNTDYRDLLHGNAQRGLDSPNNVQLLNKLQASGNMHQEITAAVHRLVDTPVPMKGELALVLENERRFLPAMENIVQLYQREAENSVRGITNVELGMSILALAILITEMLFVFRPTRNIIVKQEMELEEKIRNLTDSIHYARRVQRAILPAQHEVASHFPYSFVLYLPKDIVSGDFYWVSNTVTRVPVEGGTFARQPVIMFAVADCTGHGVPGAMVSIVCHHAIEKVVKEWGLIQPAAILDKVSGLVRDAFLHGEEAVSDGMDISLGCLNMATHELHWAGANNPLWIIRKNEDGAGLIELRPDKQPVGKNYSNKPFTNHTLKLEKGDLIYLFSDGYSDQFGGMHKKKLTRMQLKKLLLELSDTMNMTAQKDRLHDNFYDWKRDLEQLDDVCVMGLRV